MHWLSFCAQIALAVVVARNVIAARTAPARNKLSLFDKILAEAGIFLVVIARSAFRDKAIQRIIGTEAT